MSHIVKTRSINLEVFIFLLMITSVLIACESQKPSVVEDGSSIIASATSTITSTSVMLPTATDTLALTPLILEISPPSLSSTPTATPTVTNTPKPISVTTSPPTIPPIPIDTAYSSLLPATQYHLVAEGVIRDSSNSFYAVYILQDASIDIVALNNLNPEICRTVFYFWQEKQLSWELPTSTFIDSFPGQSIANREGVSPVNCYIINWDDSRGLDYLAYDTLVSPHSTDIAKEVLGLDGYKSDINSNGLPEFAILYQYYPNACINWGYVSAHFYEIQIDGTIKHITADLPGEIVPFYKILHKEEPGTLLLYDLRSSSKWERVETWWIFQWDGTAYQDVTANYADDIREWGQNRLASIREQYGEAIEWTRMDFVEILFQYEKAGLQNEAIENILEITDVSHWPDTTFHYHCWLKTMRETAIAEAEKGQPFTLPLSDLGFGLQNNYPSTCDDITRENG